jgi:hypothetical protein
MPEYPIASRFLLLLRRRAAPRQIRGFNGFSFLGTGRADSPIPSSRFRSPEVLIFDAINAETPSPLSMNKRLPIRGARPDRACARATGKRRRWSCSETTEARGRGCLTYATDLLDSITDESRSRAGVAGALFFHIEVITYPYRLPPTISRFSETH